MPETLVLLVEHNTELLSLASPDSIQVDLNQISPVLLIDRVSVDMRPFNASVVHSDVQATEPFDDLFKCFLYLRSVSNVNMERKNLDSRIFSLQLFDCGFQNLQIGVGERQSINAMLCESVRRLEADSL